MTDRTVLTGDALGRAVSVLDGWTVEDGALRKSYRFDDFVAAFAFMAGAALCAERKNHHPEWTNVYDRVDVALSTHDAGGITMFDIELAGEFDAIAK